MFEGRCHVEPVDVLYPSARGVTTYEALDSSAKSFIENIENELNINVSLIGTGPEVYETIDRRVK